MAKGDKQAAAVEAPVEVPAAAPKFSLADLAKRHGHVKPAPIAGDSPLSALHQSADVLHGWALHKHYTGEDVQLTDEDYLAALEAAKAGDPRKVHAPANHRKG